MSTQDEKISKAEAKENLAKALENDSTQVESQVESNPPDSPDTSPKGESPNEDVPLEKMIKKDLLKVANQLNIPQAKRMNKAALLQAILQEHAKLAKIEPLPIESIVLDTMFFGSEDDMTRLYGAIGKARKKLANLGDASEQQRAIAELAPILKVEPNQVLIKLSTLKTGGMLHLLNVPQEKIDLALASASVASQAWESIRDSLGAIGYSPMGGLRPNEDGKLSFVVGKVKAHTASSGTSTYVPVGDMFPGNFQVRRLLANGNVIWERKDDGTTLPVSSVGDKFWRDGTDPAKTEITSASSAALVCLAHYWNQKSTGNPKADVIPQASAAFWVKGSGDAKKPNKVYDSPIRYAKTYSGQGESVKVNYIVELA